MKILMMARPNLVGPGEGGFVQELRSAFPKIQFEEAYTLEGQIEKVGDADAVYGWVPRDVFTAGKRLKWIHIPGTGVDREITGIPELIASDIVLTNAPSSHANPMADHVFGLVVSLAHRLWEMRDDQREHRWETRKYAGRLLELSGRTMGILALGDIGKAVARRAHGFGMNVCAVDKYPERATVDFADTWGMERLDDLLEISDWVVVTAPYTAETIGLIDSRRIALLKKSAFLIVISRGGIVDESALIAALRSGRIAGAGLDATGKEPLSQESPLWDMDNVLISPHASALTQEMYDGRRETFRENIRRYLSSKPFINVCNKKDGF